jgi:hypothetical protein
VTRWRDRERLLGKVKNRDQRSEAALLNKISSNLSFGIYPGKKSENNSKTNSIFRPGLSVKCCFAACYADLTETNLKIMAGSLRTSIDFPDSMPNL